MKTHMFWDRHLYFRGLCKRIAKRKYITLDAALVDCKDCLRILRERANDQE